MIYKKNLIFAVIFEEIVKNIKILNIMEAINYIHEQLSTGKKIPSFRPGDNVVVSYKITEGAKERIQSFRGDVIQINGFGTTKTFTVRKMSNGVGVERIFPFNAPSVEDVKVLKRGKVRRAKLYYLRELVGKKARIRERKRSTK